MVPVIWLALIGAICSRIAPLFALNRTFFPVNEKATLNIKQPIRFQGLFEATNQIAGKWKTKSIMWQICNSSLQTLIFSLPKMDEFSFSRFLKDENEILQAKDQHSRDFPTFRVHFGEFFWRFSSFSSSKPARSQPRPPSQQETKKIKSYHKSRMFQDFL